MAPILNWFNGWRRDLDGWLVRARRRHDMPWLPDAVGFVEESAIAVRTHKQARALDIAQARRARDPIFSEHPHAD